MVSVDLIDEPFWTTGDTKGFRNVHVRMRLHEDPEKFTFGLMQLWDEFFQLMAKCAGGKILNSDILAALAQKMLEIETVRESQGKPPAGEKVDVQSAV